jgi:hydroxymethylpyrimidine kinase/phosphomethylpyrimidine kinase
VKKKALTIAGSDSSAGAGIQADLKTFSALGIYATTAITTLTAQNTKTVSDIFVVPKKFFKNQLETTIEDVKPDVIKVGVLYDNSIIKIVKDILVDFQKPKIIDPVLYSGTGVKLLDGNSYDSFKKNILPFADIITPNLKEAESLSNIHIESDRDLRRVASTIFDLGAKRVVIKGGHFKGNNKYISDYYYSKNSKKAYRITNKRLPIGETHGTGCNFSAAMASYIAMGHKPENAFILANTYVYHALKNATKVGDGVLVANPLYQVYNNSQKYQTLTELQKCVGYLERIDKFSLLIPETKTNFVYSVQDPTNSLEIAGVIGRMTNYGNRIRTPNIIGFGASNHVANALLIAKQFNPILRSAINIRYSANSIRICEDNFICSSYNRRLESEPNKKREGSSIKWGIKHALSKNPRAQVVYHDGDYGKEPMIILLAKTPRKILTMILTILKSCDNS